MKKIYQFTSVSCSKINETIKKNESLHASLYSIRNKSNKEYKRKKIFREKKKYIKLEVDMLVINGLKIKLLKILH